LNIRNPLELNLVDTGDSSLTLPFDYEPVRPEHFELERIFLAKGSLETPERARFVEGICAIYPDAEIIECPEVPHNRIDLHEPDLLALHRKGKRTLVFGEHKSAVRFSEEQGNTCPNYWHFSPYGFCFYGCKYCYLAGTKVTWYSPSVKIYVNLEEVLGKIDRTAKRLKRPTAFYLGKLQDGLALDALTAYSTILVPFFANHAFARQVILTKSTEVGRLLTLDHNGHTILSFSLNPPPVASRFEENVPGIDERLCAMQKCAEKGYPVRAVIMPVIPVLNWQDIYADFIRRMLAEVNIQRLTFGGICIYKNARKLMERKIGRANEISRHIAEDSISADGRMRYALSLRIEIYRHLIRIAQEARPDMELALCLEEPSVWQELKLNKYLGHCNCVL
jgi:spore photoproduct lyase